MNFNKPPHQIIRITKFISKIPSKIWCGGKFPRISMNFKRKSKAFTLVEALIAIFILTVGILSGFILITKVLYSTVVIQDRLTASFLAQEGIELVRQIRDSNFLRILGEESADWRDGLGDGTYIIESRVDSQGSIGLVPIGEDESRFFLYNDTLKIYNYSTGEPTTFNRKIKITTIPGSDDEIRIEAIMKWKTKGIDFELTVEDHLYNWMKL